MKYLRAVIDRGRQSTVYKKDFQVQKVFAMLVRAFVGILIDSDRLKEGEFYRTFIVPRYGQYHILPSNTTAPRVVSDQGPLITLDYQEPVQPDRPVDFFSIDIYVPRLSSAYRANFQMQNLDYFWHNIDRALLHVGIVEDKDELHHKLYARDDDLANFEREEIGTNQQNDAPLIEILPADDVPLSLPSRVFADFPILSITKLVRGQLLDEPYVESSARAERKSVQQGVHILIAQSALRDLQQIARSGSPVEQGGALVGSFYEDQSSDNYFVEIVGHIAAEGAIANEVELRYTFESWQLQNKLLKERFPNKRVVGWYHTHLDLVKKTYITNEPRQSTYTTPLFFSKDDLFTHRQFFSEKWYVAMVLDPRGNLTFFQWNGDEIGESSCFYVISSQTEE